jgi:hypothetical protein
MTLQFLIDASGLTALAINASGLARTSDASLRTKTGVASALWALNNFFMGAYSAAALSALTVGRQATASAVHGASDRVRDVSCAVFLLLTCATGALTWQGPSTLFTTLGSSLATYAMFYWRAARLRVAMVLVSVLWMYNAWAYHSWWQAAANLMACGAALFGAWRTRQ